MKLLSSDRDILKQISVFYSVVNFLIVSCILLVLFLTESYLLVGCGKIYPLFLFLIVFEFCKWCFLVIVFKKDFTVNKNSVFGLLYKSFKFASIVRTTAILFISCAGYYIIIVLFGAEILNKIEETLMFSILLTLLTAMPISIQLGSSYFESFVQGVKPKNIFQSLMFNNSRGTLIGAWFGAFVIPLDWDRPWQAWPIPCFLGALFGYTLSNTLYFTVMTAMQTRIINQKVHWVLGTLLNNN